MTVYFASQTDIKKILKIRTYAALCGLSPMSAIAVMLSNLELVPNEDEVEDSELTGSIVFSVPVYKIEVDPNDIMIANNEEDYTNIKHYGGLYIATYGRKIEYYRTYYVIGDSLGPGKLFKCKDPNYMIGSDDWDKEYFYGNNEYMFYIYLANEFYESAE